MTASEAFWTAWNGVCVFLAFCAGGILPFLILTAGVAYVCARIAQRVRKSTR